MQEKLTIQFSPTRLKQMKKIALSGSRAKLKILNGKMTEGFHLLKSTAKKFKSFATDLADRIPQVLAARISLDLFSHFESKSSKRLGIPKGIVLGGVLALMCSLPAAGQTIYDVTTTVDGGVGSLRQAILDANADLTSSTILLDDGLLYTLGASSLPIVGNDFPLQIICTGTANARIDGAGAFRPLTMGINSNLTITKITVQNGSATQGGGIFNNRGNLTVSNSLITNNAATAGYGGGIYSRGSGGTASVLIQNSTISMNTASVYGGGIANYSNSPMTISNSFILGNTSSNKGGGIFNYNNSPLTISNSSISGNTSTNSAGGIFNSGNSPMTISSSSISGNVSSYKGGGIYNKNSNLTVSSSSISGNTGNHQGGGLYSYGADINIQASSINANQSANQGGGIFSLDYNGGASFVIQNTTISGNTSTGSSGGGIHHYNYDSGGGNTNITLQHVTIANNTGVGTGGFSNSFNGPASVNITLQNTIIANSTGADFDLSAGTLTLVTATISGDGTLVHANAITANPLLNALSGGVHTLQVGSPAIDAASAGAATANDQLGVLRVAPHDIGAVQFGAVACMVVVAPAGVTNTWIGCTNSDWQTASNWSLGTVPTASDVVYVPNVAANDLIIDEVATCAKILVQFGAKCIVNYNAGGQLRIKF